MAIFIWNGWNVSHIAGHGVLPAEAEAVVRGAVPPWPRNAGNGKLLVWGRTSAGRLLQVIYVLPEDDEIDFNDLTLEDLAALDDGEEPVYVIHAMPLTPRMTNQYRRQGGT